MSLSSAVEVATHLVAKGQTPEAVRLVADAAQKGDAEAVHLQALWHVYGHPFPRDFKLARGLFERAGKLGHAESANIHAVFVAIGAGAPPNWQKALDLLSKAALADPTAARQRDLIEAMQLRSDGKPTLPPKIALLANRPRLGMVEGLFTKDECSHLIALAAPQMVPSVVVDPQTGRQSPHPIRTSDGTVLGPIQQDLVIHALNMRIAAVTATLEQQGEPLSLLRYAQGQQYKLHHDCLPAEQNQRIMTVITYLNDDFGDGGTYFAALDRSYKPPTGSALLFVNTLSDGRADESSRHAGLPVSHGEKWVCTRWIRKNAFDPWGMRL